MTDNVPHSCGGRHPQDACDHVSGPGSPCCNNDRYPCPQHFTELLSQGMLALSAGEHERASGIMSHIGRHRWLLPALLTWSALIRRYGSKPGQTRDAAIAEVGTSIPADDRQRPWLFRLGVVVRAAIADDGDTILDALKSVRGDPAMDSAALMSLVTSVALAGHDAVAQHRVHPGTLAVLLTLGSQTLNAPGFRILDTVAQIADRYEDPRGGGPDEDLVARMGDATPDELLSGVGIVGRALGQVIDLRDTGPVIVSRQGTGMGFVDWRDRSLDPGRGREEMSPVWSMRVAAAFARHQVDEVSDMCQQAEDPVLWCVDVIVGSCVMIGGAVVSLVEQSGT